MKRALTLILILISFALQSQELTQTVRGTVIDKQTQSPLPGAVVQVLNAEPQKVTTTDENGKFRLDNIPLGRWQIKFSVLSYKEKFNPSYLLLVKKLF